MEIIDSKVDLKRVVDPLDVWEGKTIIPLKEVIYRGHVFLPKLYDRHLVVEEYLQTAKFSNHLVSYKEIFDTLIPMESVNTINETLSFLWKHKRIRKFQVASRNKLFKDSTGAHDYWYVVQNIDDFILDKATFPKELRMTPKETEKFYRIRLTFSDAQAIREDRKRGMTIKAIATKYRQSNTSIIDVLQGRKFNERDYIQADIEV